jgi:drug/metabolite transporter (DMT)-like permease
LSISLSLNKLQPLKGVVFYLFAVLTFAMVGATIKWLGHKFYVTEIVFYRNFFVLVPTVIWLLWTKKYHLIKTTRYKKHLSRDALGISGMFFMFMTYTHLPLATASTVLFTAPFFIAALSIPVLGEKVGIHRWSAIGFGFVGVVIAANPFGGELSWGIMYGILGAFFQAYAMLTLRGLSRTESNFTIIFYFHLFGTVVGGISLFFYFTVPSFSDIFFLLCIAGFGALAQLLLTQAHRIAPAALLAPFNYTTLIWATLLGYFVFGDIPGIMLFVGGGIIIISGLYILYREFYIN